MYIFLLHYRTCSQDMDRWAPHGRWSQCFSEALQFPCICQSSALHIFPGNSLPVPRDLQKWILCCSSHCQCNSFSCSCSPSFSRTNWESAGQSWVKRWLLVAIIFPKGFRSHFLAQVIPNPRERLWHQQALRKLNTKCSYLQKDPSSRQLVTTMPLRKKIIEGGIQAGLIVLDGPRRVRS